MSNKTINDKLREGRSYRSMEVRALDDPDLYQVEGYATTFGEPYLLYSEEGWRLFEQVDSRAFDNADMSDVIMQYDHQGRVFARRSNGTLTVEPDEHGLKVRADLSGTEIGRQLWQEIKGGYTTRMSFGFTVDTDTRVTTEEPDENLVTVVRTITGVKKLYDVSAVSIPANNGTEISARADGEGVIAEAKEELQQEKELRAEKLKRLAVIRLLKEV